MADFQPHHFVGRQDRWCEICNRTDRDPIHILGLPGDEDTEEHSTIAIPLNVNEINETGIREITIGGVDYYPLKTEVKWFRDELGQLWTKLYQYNTANQKQCLVFPAALVERVVYPKNTY